MHAHKHTSHALKARISPLWLNELRPKKKNLIKTAHSGGKGGFRRGLFLIRGVTVNRQAQVVLAQSRERYMRDLGPCMNTFKDRSRFFLQLCFRGFSAEL